LTNPSSTLLPQSSLDLLQISHLHQLLKIAKREKSGHSNRSSVLMMMLLKHRLSFSHVINADFIQARRDGSIR
jgi:hypothetical protein